MSDQSLRLAACIKPFTLFKANAVFSVIFSLILAMGLSLSSQATAQTSPRSCKVLSSSTIDFGRSATEELARTFLNTRINNWKKTRKRPSATRSEDKMECVVWIELGITREYRCTASAKLCW